MRRFFTSSADVASAIREERVRQGLSQSALAESAGVSRKFVNEIEGGHERAELGKVLAVFQALDIQALALPAPPRTSIDDVDLEGWRHRYA